MKKLVVLISIVIISGYLIYSSYEIKEIVKEREVELQKDISALKEVLKKKGIDKEMTEDEILKETAALIVDQMADNRWMLHIKEVFDGEFQNDPEAYNDYQSMKASFEEDRLDLYDDFMEKVRNENKSFNITELEDGPYKELEEEYLKAFQKRYGQKVFLKYLEAKEKHNEENPSFPLYF